MYINGSANGTASNDVSVTVSEPTLSVTKTRVITGPVDAGATVDYTVTINAASGANQTTAYDLSLTDVFNSYLVDLSETGRTTNPVTPNACLTNTGTTVPFAITGGFTGNTYNLTANCLEPGNRITLTFRATLASSIPAGYTLNNTANLSYTSLPTVGTLAANNPTGSVAGAPSGDTGERTGGGGVNDYQASGTIGLTVASPTIDKITPTPTQYTIGENVTYDILVTLPEGLTPSVVVADQLPLGMSYVSSQVVTQAASSNGHLSADFAGSFTTPSPVPTVVSGSAGSVSLNFGDTTTTNDDITGNNSFVVRVVALVMNDAANDRDGQSKTNTASLQYLIGATPHSITDTATVSLIEPRITTNKVVTSPTGNVQAGDTVAYRVTFTNTGHSQAYDVTAQDVLTAGVTYDSGSAACTLGGNPSGVTVSGTSTLSFSANPAGSWDLPVGSAIVCTYTVTAQNSIYLDGNHVNTVDADWYSLDAGSGRAYNDGVTYPFDGTQDTHTASFPTAGVTISKDNHGADQVAVGSSIYFTLTIPSPLGTLRSAVVTDVLPAGLVYTANSQNVSAGISAATFTVSSPNDGSVPVTLTWNFGDAVVTQTPVTIDYYASVANVLTNQNLHVLTNNVTLNYLDAGGSPKSSTDTTSSTVVEPRISTTKTVSPTSGVELTDTLTYTVNFTNDGTSTAYDVTAEDVLPSGVLYAPGSAACSLDGSPIEEIVGGTTTLAFSGNPAGAWDIPVGSTIQCTYEATAQSDMLLDGDHTNTVDADWYSQDNAGGRFYNDTTTYTVDGTQDTDTATFSSPGANLVKDNGGVTSVVIGDMIHYTLTITSGTGTLQNMSVSDTIPAGMLYVSGSQVVSSNVTPGPGAAGFSTSGPTDGSGPVTLTWGFGDAVISGSPVRIEYDVQVANVASNQELTTLPNDATLSYTNVAGDTVTSDDSTSVTVHEPVLEIGKSASTLSVAPDAGDVVSYTVTIAHASASPAAAYEVHYQDTLPAITDLDTSTISVLVNSVPVTPALNDSDDASNTIDITLASLATTDTLTITYQAVLTAAVTPGELVENTGHIDWSSQAGDHNSGELDGERDGSGGINDYNASDTASISASTGITFAKSLFATSFDGTTANDVVIGETVTYALRVTYPEVVVATTQLIDYIPAGMQYVSYQVVTAAAQSNALLAADFAGTIPTPAVSGGSEPGLPVQFDFGRITVTGDNDDTNNSFLVLVTTRVLNVEDNQESTLLSNTAELSVDGGTPMGSEQVDVIINEPVLSLDKSADVEATAFDHEITYTLVLDNSFQAIMANAYDVEVADELPAGLSYVDGSITAPAGWTADDSQAPELHWNGDLPLGGTVTFTYRAVVDTPITPGTVLENSARATWTSLPGDVNSGSQDGERDGSGDFDDYRSDDTADVSYANFDLYIAKSDDPDPVTPGADLTYTLTYGNAGNITASGVMITETVPAHTVYSLAGNTAPWSCAGYAAGSTCTLALGDVVPDEWEVPTDPIPFVVTVDTPLPAEVAELSNTASIDDSDFDYRRADPG